MTKVMVVMECGTFPSVSGQLNNGNQFSKNSCLRKDVSLRFQSSASKCCAWSYENSKSGCCLQPAAAAAVSTIPDAWVASEEATTMAAASQAVALARAALLAAKQASTLLNDRSEELTLEPEEHTIEVQRDEDVRATEEAASALERLVTVEADEQSLENNREMVDIAVASKRRKQRKDLRATAMEKKRKKQERVKAMSQDIVDNLPAKSAKQPTGKDGFFPQIVRRGRLSPAEELRCVRGVQEFVKMEQTKSRLAQELGRDPTFKEWSEGMKMEPDDLEIKLYDARLCKNMVISSNMGLVIKVARKFASVKGASVEDLIQEGINGLLKGVEKFDTTRGFRLSTYVLWWIELAVRRAAVKYGLLCQVPMHLFDLHTKLTKTRAAYYQEHGIFPTDEEMAKILGTSPARVILASNLMIPTKSLSDRIPGCDKLTHMDILADPDTESPYIETERKLLKNQVEQVLSRLKPREKEVLCLRHGLADGKVRTLEELGHMFGLSRERIRQIEKKALRRIEDTGGKDVLSSFALTFACNMQEF